MGAADENHTAGMEFVPQPWGWEGEAPSLSPEQTALLDSTIAEVRQNPLCSGVDAAGGRSAVWRYLEGAQWRAEPTRGKRVSDYFVETLEWRAQGEVDTILGRGHTFEDEAASGKLFVRGSSLLGRPLIWLHAGRENNALDPEANIRLLVYTVVSPGYWAMIPFPTSTHEWNACSLRMLPTSAEYSGVLSDQHLTPTRKGYRKPCSLPYSKGATVASQVPLR